MELKELKSKADALKIEIVKYSGEKQAEINQLQQLLQNKAREAQKHVDNLEGKLAGYLELIKSEENPDKPKKNGKT